MSSGERDDEARGESGDSPRASWRHDSGDETILERAEESQDEAIRRARIAIGRAGVRASRTPTRPVPAPIPPTRVMPLGDWEAPSQGSVPAPDSGKGDRPGEETVVEDGQPPAPSGGEANPVIIPRKAPQPPVEAKARPERPSGPIPGAIIFSLLLGLLATTLPLTSAIIGTILTWILAARGRSVLHQYRREENRGGFRRHGDGVKEAIRSPLYALEALPTALGSFGLWAVFLAFADLLAIGLFHLPSTPLEIPLPTQTLLVPLVAGRGTGPGALLLGVAGVGSSAILFFAGGRTRAVRLGLSVVWLSLQRGMCRLIGRESRLLNPLHSGQVSGIAFPVGFQAYGGEMGYGSPQEVRARHHGGEVIGLLLLVLVTVTLVAAGMRLGGTVDWAPLVTGTDF